MRDDDFSLIDYAHVFWRRKWIFLSVSLLVFAVALVVIARIPIIYRSTGVILVEQQEIPTQWVNSTVSSFADERIKAISQRVLKSSNLEDIINKHELFVDRRGKVPMDRLVDRVRHNFTIDTTQARIRDRVSGRGNSGTVAIQISYDDPSPDTAKEVASELVSLYLDENLKARTQAAADTRRFLESEADRLERELGNLEEKISIFKEKNLNALPEHQNINLQSYQRVEQQIADIDRTLGSLEERAIILETSIDSARRLLTASRVVDTDTGVAVVDPTFQRLEELRAQYMSLQTRYSAYHPDLIRLRREIGLLESQISETSGSSTNQLQLQSLMAQLQEAKNRYSDQHPEVVRLEREINAFKESNPADASGSVGSSDTIVLAAVQEDSSLIALRTDLQSTKSEQRSLRARKASLTRKLSDLEAQINKTPEVEREYRSLIRDHQNIQNKYNDIRAKQNSARVAESLESEQKAERFTLLEAPRVAKTPFSPNHKKLFALALGFAFLGGLGSVFGLEIIDARVRNIRSLESLTGVPVLATVGVIENDIDRSKRKIKFLLIVLLGVIVLGAIFYLMYAGQVLEKGFRPRQILESIQNNLAVGGVLEEKLNMIRDWIKKTVGN